MAVLLIKHLPKELHRRLKQHAAANGRSLSSEAITILENALHDQPDPPPLEQIDLLRVHGAVRFANA